MLILCAAVTLWVGGFDVLYACQDVEFDKRRRPAFDSEKVWHCAGARLIARAMHVVMVALLAWLAWSFHLAWPAWAGIAVVAALLAYEHSLVKPNDLSKMNAAFFTVNGYISLLFLLFWGAAAVVTRRRNEAREILRPSVSLRAGMRNCTINEPNFKSRTRGSSPSRKRCWRASA